MANFRREILSMSTSLYFSWLLFSQAIVSTAIHHPFLTGLTLLYGFFFRRFWQIPILVAPFVGLLIDFLFFQKLEMGELGNFPGSLVFFGSIALLKTPLGIIAVVLFWLPLIIQVIEYPRITLCFVGIALSLTFTFDIESRLARSFPNYSQQLVSNEDRFRFLLSVAPSRKAELLQFAEKSKISFDIQWSCRHLLLDPMNLKFREFFQSNEIGLARLRGDLTSDLDELLRERSNCIFSNETELSERGLPQPVVQVRKLKPAVDVVREAHGRVFELNQKKEELQEKLRNSESNLKGWGHVSKIHFRLGKFVREPRTYSAFELDDKKPFYLLMGNSDERLIENRVYRRDASCHLQLSLPDQVGCVLISNLEALRAELTEGKKQLKSSEGLLKKAEDELVRRKAELDGVLKGI